MLPNLKGDSIFSLLNLNWSLPTSPMEGSAMNQSGNLKQLLDWPHLIRANQLNNCPYDTTAVAVREYLDRSGATRFLGLNGGMSQCERFGLAFLTPAPIDCPMRDGFETGEISWSDYWDSREMLICWEYSMYDASHVTTRICSPREFSPMARSHIDCKWIKSPLETKRDVLVNKVNIEKFGKRDSSVAEAEYESFMRVYERRMKKRAA
jgi:hypothetical protein